MRGGFYSYKKCPDCGKSFKYKEKARGLTCPSHPDRRAVKEKVIPMLEEDRELINKLPVGLPELPFFRHNLKVRGCAPGLPFGEKYHYKWWNKACLIQV